MLEIALVAFLVLLLAVAFANCAMFLGVNRLLFVASAFLLIGLILLVDMVRCCVGDYRAVQQRHSLYVPKRAAVASAA